MKNEINFPSIGDLVEYNLFADKQLVLVLSDDESSNDLFKSYLHKYYFVLNMQSGKIVSWGFEGKKILPKRKEYENHWWKVL